MRQICILCGETIPVEPKFRESGKKEPRQDPRIRHIQDKHRLKDVIRLGRLFVATDEEYQALIRKILEFLSELEAGSI